MYICVYTYVYMQAVMVAFAFAATLSLASPQCFSEHSLHGRRAVTLASLESTEKAVDTGATHCTFGGPLQYHQLQQSILLRGGGLVKVII